MNDSLFPRRCLTLPILALAASMAVGQATTPSAGQKAPAAAPKAPAAHSRRVLPPSEKIPPTPPTGGSGGNAGAPKKQATSK